MNMVLDSSSLNWERKTFTFDKFNDKTKTSIANNHIEVSFQTFDSIIINNEKVMLKRPIVFLVEQTEFGIFISNEEVNVVACGFSMDEVIINMYEELSIQYTLYVENEDDNLTPRALQLKTTLRNLLEHND